MQSLPLKQLYRNPPLKLIINPQTRSLTSSAVALAHAVRETYENTPPGDPTLLLGQFSRAAGPIPLARTLISARPKGNSMRSILQAKDTIVRVSGTPFPVAAFQDPAANNRTKDEGRVSRGFEGAGMRRDRCGW